MAFELGFEIALIENDDGEFVMQYRASHTHPWIIFKKYKGATQAIEGYGSIEAPGKDLLALQALITSSKAKNGRILKYDHYKINY